MADQRPRMASASEAGGHHSLNGCRTQMVSLVCSGVLRSCLIVGQLLRVRNPRINLTMRSFGSKPEPPVDKLSGLRSAGNPSPQCILAANFLNFSALFYDASATFRQRSQPLIF